MNRIDFEMPMAPDSGKRGSYILLLDLASAVALDVGKAGHYQFASGSYLYIGSALGPGGVRARLRHHLKRSEKPHWHIDYLRHHASVAQIWFVETGEGLEHHWAGLVAQLQGCQPVTPGLGASDCGCKTHLFYFQHPPQIEQLQLAIEAGTANGSQLQLWRGASAEQ